MPKVSLYNMNGEVIGDIELSENIFGAEINTVVMHDVVKAYLANQRQGTQSALTRAEVRGGGAKPWKQKGTGRARQGSIRAPQWTHGGIVFAPKPREYRITLNKKVKKIALKSALSSKLLDENIIVVDTLNFDTIKTKNVVNVLKALNVSSKALIVTANANDNVYRSAKNIQGVATLNATDLHTYEVLKNDKFIITKDALAKIEEVFA